MAAYETIEVPIHILPDGREFITEESVIEHPEIGDFVDYYSNYWTHDWKRKGWVGPARESVH